MEALFAWSVDEYQTDMLYRHSSSSAIFERDVEPSPSHPLSPHPHITNPHRTPRSKITEALDQSVPTVLDSAAALLTSTDGEFDESMIAIEAPVPIAEASRAGSSIGSPIGRGSRSPSPTTSAGRNRTSMLLNLPSPIQSSIVPLSVSPRTSPPLPGSPTRPPPPPLVTNFTPAPIPGPSAAVARNGIVETEAHPPRSATPTSVGGDTQYESATSSPTTTTLERPPHPLPTPTTSTFMSQQASPQRNAQILPAPGLSHQLSSHPPSPSHAAHKRLSFVSYNDILASTPISTVPLSSFTSPGSIDSPPHIPPVSLSVSAAGIAPGLGSRSVSAAASAAGSARNSLFISSDNSILNGICRAADIKEPTGGAADEVGGEWEREGLGRGLEERLEALMTVGPGKA